MHPETSGHMGYLLISESSCKTLNLSVCLSVQHQCHFIHNAALTRYHELRLKKERNTPLKLLTLQSYNSTFFPTIQVNSINFNVTISIFN